VTLVVSVIAQSELVFTLIDCREGANHDLLGRNIFVIALSAAVLGFGGISGTAVHLAWICAIIGIFFPLSSAQWGVARKSKREMLRPAV